MKNVSEDLFMLINIFFNFSFAVQLPLDVGSGGWEVNYQCHIVNIERLG